MPRLIDAGTGVAWSLDDLVAALDRHPFDPRDEDSIADAGPLLARLGRDPRFLADLAIDELKTRCTAQSAANRYGAQVFLLRPPNGRYLLRANFWPAPRDPVVRASGAAAFFYDHAHDHNFSFLTYGYLGPGYWSDDYQCDPANTAGVAGEPARLRGMGRSRLEPGRLMLYRRSIDVHRQLPPDAFSVSLNVLVHDAAQAWIDQYRYDLATGTIAEGLTVAPAEGLVALAARFGGEDGIDLVTHCAARHPATRLRVTALRALVAAEAPHAVALLERAADAPCPLLAAQARLLVEAKSEPIAAEAA